MERTHKKDAEAVNDDEQVPPMGTPTDNTAARTGTGTRQVLVIAAATVIGWIAAVDEKPWWRWLWDAVSTGFEDTDRYTVDWRLFRSSVALGVAVARWLAGRGREEQPGKDE